MTAEAKHFIEEFQALSDAEKQEVLVEILRVAAAEGFAAYDAEEDAQRDR
ncbi:MAG TPA: hypothetical protein VG323_18630 [Thermoanaerobaculia bacterium]|nr:hypothetical protein [Thermoanaerobaculia bacterium]